MINVLDLAQICLAVFCFFLIRCVTRNLQWGLVCGGVGAELSAAGDMGVLGRSLQRSKILYFFGKNNLILGLF